MTDEATGGAGEGQQPPKQQQQAPPQRPEHVPEKFWDAQSGRVNTEAWAKSYTDTQAALTKAQQQLKGQTQPEDDGVSLPQAPPATALLADDEAGIPQLLQTVGLTEQELAQSMVANDGKLTDDQYAKLKAAGFGKAFVDQTIAAKLTLTHQALAQARQQCEQIAGGKPQWDNLRAWAAQNLSDSDKQFYEANSANPATAPQAAQWLLQQHREAVGAGKAEPLVSGDGAAASGQPKPFASRAEFQQARRDARYRTDSTYRKAVDDRAMATNFNAVL